MSFEIWQRVVCIEDDPGLFASYPNPKWPSGAEIKRGAIYTVCGHCTRLLGGLPCVLLDGRRKVNWIGGALVRTGYWVERFEPLPRKRADIEVFKRLLVPVAGDLQLAE